MRKYKFKIVKQTQFQENVLCQRNMIQVIITLVALYANYPTIAAECDGRWEYRLV